jgi:hypothetical protein
MIPKADIVAWREHAPWIDDVQVEQDLLISRSIVELFRNESLGSLLVFRGGTALHKLHLGPPKRYSEDLDFVQKNPGPIGPLFDMLRATFGPFLGEPRRKQGPGVVTLTFRVETDGPPILPIRIKIEINSREHFAVFGYQILPFEVRSRWFSGRCQATTFSLEELLGSKMRALFQRRKGRDLFDLWLGLAAGKADPEKIAFVFGRLLKQEGLKIGGEVYRRNLDEKLSNPAFSADIRSLIPRDVVFDYEAAAELVRKELLEKLPEES